MKDKPITPAQLKALQTIFSRKGWDSQERHAFINHYTSGRTASSKGLTMFEAQRLLKEFNGLSTEERAVRQAKNLMKSIYWLSLQINFLNKGYESDCEEERLMNYAKLNKFCRERTAARKNLTHMSLEELAATKKQLESIMRKQG
jgi:hypothetical protein